MKVAIMGAGLSGLSCAIVLERNGISPDIFESRRLPGDRFINGEVLLNILNRPINNCLPYFSVEYGIKLAPISPLRKMTIYSPNKSGVIRGSIGYSNMRGRHPDSFENQLASQVKSNIVYNSKKTYDDLIREYTHVVVATGDAKNALDLKNFREDITVAFKGATVDGEFDISHVSAWLNNDFAPKGYGWLIPLSNREANITLAYPEYIENMDKDINILWDKFYSRVRKDTGQSLKILDTFQTTGYILGISQKPKINNTYFTGNCFGSIMPAFGFGQFASILTGVYAAHDICGMGSFEMAARSLYKSYDNSLIIRRAVEKLDNDGFDTIAHIFDNPAVGAAFNNTVNFDAIRAVSKLIKPILKL